MKMPPEFSICLYECNFSLKVDFYFNLVLEEKLIALNESLLLAYS